MLRLSDPVVMTAEGLQALQAELEQLETVARREIAERIKTAREWGDLKENSEYHDAKNDQAHLETKILRLREQLLAAEVREVETQTDVVGFGSCVEVEDASPASSRPTRWSPPTRPTRRRASSRSTRRWARRCSAARSAASRSFETPRGTRELKVLKITA